MRKRTLAVLTGIFLAIGCSDSPAQEPAASPSSISPDKQWEYKCKQFGNLGQCAPVIVKAGTDDEEVDLLEELGITGPDVRETQVVWAPDSKRFACNYSPPHTHSSTYVEVAFYQLQGDKWVLLDSPTEEGSSRVQLAQLGKGHLPRDFNPAQCSKNQDELKVTSWLDPSRAVVYAPCYGRTDGEKKAGFLFTLKFDDAGRWKVVATHRMSKKELEETDR